VKSGQASALSTWAEFQDLLTTAFRPHELSARYAQQLLHISQGKCDMRTYIANFNAARARIPGMLKEIALSHVFLQGCRPEFRNAIALQKPQTLDQYIEAAVLVADINAEHMPPQHSRRPEKESSGKGPAPNPPSKLVCSHCNKSGHRVDRCFQLHPELKTRGKKKD
jgi:hypothetical protein